MEVEIKKTSATEVLYGDRASKSYAAARYGVFVRGKKVGFIIGTDKTYRGPSRRWSVNTTRGQLVRNFYQPNALAKAKTFARNHRW